MNQEQSLLFLFLTISSYVGQHSSMFNIEWFPLAGFAIHILISLLRPLS